MNPDPRPVQAHAPVAEGACLHSLAESSARRTPGALALVDGAASLTYAQLEARAEAAARRLTALGVGPGSIVGLAARRRIDTIVAILGALKAGAAYCPLDPAYPLERLSFMLEDSKAAALVAGRADAQSLAHPARPTVLLETLQEPGPVGPAPRAAGASDLAYVLYTSGSTGKPKGVMVEHGSAVNLVRGLLDLDVIRPGERALLFASLSFDVSVGELFSALAAGATLVLRGDQVLPPQEFVRHVEELKIERLTLPTAYWHAVAAALSPMGQTLPACVRSIVVAGEALRAESLAYWRPATGRVRFINAYGPTEATVYASYYEIPADAPAAGVVPIGRSLAGADLSLADADGKPVPDGSEGELWIGGPGVARDYLNRPELTAARFVPDPASGRPGARAYRTGDRVCRRPDGVLEYLGRTDDQVKINGFRVELGEIEAMLLTHPGVGTCAVVKREDTPGAPRLVGYVSPGAGGPAAPEALRAFLLKKLPEHMVPSAIVALDLLPLTPAGKVDRRALPQAAPVAPASSAASKQERAARERLTASPLQLQMLRIWERLLAVSPVCLDDDFFALGGTSMMALQMMVEVEKTAGRRPPIVALSKGATIASLSAAMADEPRAAAAAAAAPAPAAARAARRPFWDWLLGR